MPRFLGFKKIGGHFDSLGLVSGGNFQILGVIFYIMYMVVTSDVNKNATFLGITEVRCWNSVWVFWLGNSNPKYINQYFLDWLRKWPISCFKSRTNHWLHSKMNLESQSYILLSVKKTIISQFTNWIIGLSTYERVNFIQIIQEVLIIRGIGSYNVFGVFKTYNCAYRK